MYVCMYVCIYPSIHPSIKQKLYDNVEIQHRILAANPMLAGIKGFGEASGRRLNDADVRRLDGWMDG